ncbi:MAG: dTDP-4-dehydrorhamnose 3,5-epimerase [candidate division WS2 bacterium]|uniref:dTDP-4-dehydrorhamnose 3,5-epimerase n=1 Tax=Psychracetigena formicireducens TaxID=2986056 RepID=A0A9E2BJA2_PSYF1|nr:dTDP-4-dehydrorhamnose 3,5-epimerase [Candidatus Psychracetigena formicireducens]
MKILIIGKTGQSFLTAILEDDTVVFYQMSEFYHPECARGVRWDDPVFGIKWPLLNPIISEKDKNYPDFSKTYGRSI